MRSISGTKMKGENMDVRSCKNCQCNRCGNVDCGWHGCVLGKPGENCFIADCMQYENEQDYMKEGLRDRYE